MSSVFLPCPRCLRWRLPDAPIRAACRASLRNRAPKAKRRMSLHTVSQGFLTNSASFRQITVGPEARPLGLRVPKAATPCSRPAQSAEEWSDLLNSWLFHRVAGRYGCPACMGREACVFARNGTKAAGAASRYA